MFGIGYYGPTTNTVTDLKRPHHNFESAKSSAVKMQNHPAFNNRIVVVIDYSVVPNRYYRV